MLKIGNDPYMQKNNKLKKRKKQDKNRNKLKIALSYYSRGLSPIPLKHNSKKPKIKWSKYQDNPPTREQVLQFNYDNVGLLTGKTHNLLVVDLDSQQAIHWFYEQFNNLPPITPVVKTSRGIHLYYKYPQDLSISKVKLRDKVEIFGNKHQVCAPPSKHPSGKKYEWLNSLEVGLKQLPAWIIKHADTSGVKYSATSQRATESNSEGAISTKSTKKLKKPHNIDINTKTINDLLNHRVFNGKAKSGSCNGRYLSHLITGFRLGLDKSKAIKATKNKYPTLGKKTIQDSAKQVYKQGYGLSPNKMVDIGINKNQADSLFEKVLEVTGGYLEVEHTKSYQSKEQFNRNVFKASLALTLTNTRTTNYQQFAELSDTSKSTLAHKSDKDLPQFVEIKSINGKGIIVYNYLPIFLGILAQLAQYLYLSKALNTTPLQNSYVVRAVNSSSSFKRNNNISHQDRDSIKIRGSPN